MTSSTAGAPLLILVIGPSGVGKSTLLEASVTRDWPGRSRVTLMSKETTRPLRGSAEQFEMRNISWRDFVSRRDANYYLAHYERFGEAYGVPRDALDADLSHDVVTMQTFPTIVAAQVKKLFEDRRRVAICLMEADEHIVKQRLHTRADSGTMSTLTERMQTFHTSRHYVADKTINCNGSREEVFEEYSNWVIQSNLSH